MISVINYGLGNLGSIMNMFRYLDIEAEIIEHPGQIESATKLLLPGVGAFDAGMKHLNDTGWINPLNEAVLGRKIPILGICLGMQLMTQGSEEGEMKGLGWIPGVAKKFTPDVDNKLKIPHMGWSNATPTKASTLFPEMAEENRFYFVHSYYVALKDSADELLSTHYGSAFTSGFQHDNITGVQFHPEKSHSFGKRFFQRFSAI